jgi:hypothetical protein
MQITTFDDFDADQARRISEEGLTDPMGSKRGTLWRGEKPTMIKQPKKQSNGSVGHPEGMAMP